MISFMFLLKKLASGLLFPLSLVIILLLIGTLLKRGKRIVLAGIVLLYLFSYGPFPCLLLWPLERGYAPVSASALNREVRWIVVLGAGWRENNVLTPEDNLDDASLKRLMEGM